MGDGIPSVPEKIAANIRKGEFVEMGELLSKFWFPREDGDSGRETKVRRRLFIFSRCICLGVCPLTDCGASDLHADDRVSESRFLGFGLPCSPPDGP